MIFCAASFDRRDTCSNVECIVSGCACVVGGEARAFSFRGE